MRKTKLVPIPDEGRDKDKLYILTEMPATQAEKWALRVLLACGRAGIDIPEDAYQRGMIGVLAVGVLSLARMAWVDAEPLLDEMMECVKIAPDRRNLEVVRGLVETDIEEVATRVKLREEVFKLHTDFSFADVLSALSLAMTSAQPSQNTPTSPPSSEPSSPPASPS